MEFRVGLCIQAEENQFQHLLQPNYLHIYRRMYTLSFVFIGKLLCDLYLLIRDFFRMNYPVASRPCEKEENICPAFPL
jgi:hypothetical protein